MYPGLFWTAIYIRSAWWPSYRAFSDDVTAAILVFQINSLGIELFSYVNTFFFPVNLDRCWTHEWKRSINSALSASLARMKQAQVYFLIRPKQVQAAIKHDMFFGSWREINEGHGKWPIVLTRVVIDGLRQNRVRVSRPRRHTPTKMFHRCPTPGGRVGGGGGLYVFWWC